MNKNKRKMFMIGMIRYAFPVTEMIVPELAKKWANQLFFTPFRFQSPVRELEIFETANRFVFPYKGISVQGYEWGEGPVVFLMHGWAGRAGQFFEFIKAAVAAGYKVIAFDAPAHGFSKGNRTNILEFVEAIKLINEMKGPFYAAIGHSLGGTALLLSVKQGVDAEKVVTLSVPSIAELILDEFRKKINASAKINLSIKTFVKRKYQVEFEQFSAGAIVSNSFPRKDLLIIHDEEDKEAPIVHFDELSKLLPNAEKIVTRGLGHNRILRDPYLIDKVVSFLNQGREAIKNKHQDNLRIKTRS